MLHWFVVFLHICSFRPSILHNYSQFNLFSSFKAFINLLRHDDDSFTWLHSKAQGCAPTGLVVLQQPAKAGQVHIPVP